MDTKSHIPNLVEVEKTIVKNFKTISLGEIADIGIGLDQLVKIAILKNSN